MSDDEDYNSESDVDYVPSDGEPVSEEEESGDDEGLEAPGSGNNSVTQLGGNNRGKKRKKKQILTSRRRTGGIKLENKDGSEGQTDDISTAPDDENKALKEGIALEAVQQKEEKEKKKADDLWSSFLTDVNKRGKGTPSASSSSSSQQTAVATTNSKTSSIPASQGAVSSSKCTSGQLSITKIFDFAGEEVRITKQVDIASKEGQNELKKMKEDDSTPSSAGSTYSDPQRVLVKNPSESPTLTPEVKASPTCAIEGMVSNDWRGQLGKFGGGSGGKGAGGRGGLSSILGQIGKKPTISTLNKSKLDWESFKKEEDIEEDLSIHNRGKDGYIERLDFLSRTDKRQFEAEKDLRLRLGSKR